MTVRSINRIYQLIQPDLVKVEENLTALTRVDFPWLSELLSYCFEGGGKRIRPAVTLLAGQFYDYDLDTLLPMATSVEVMHTSTLVHDDAIDKADIRRGRPTINKIWDDETAVLLGDYMFARAGQLAADTNNIRVVKLFAQTLAIISSGELNQAYNAFNLKQTRQQYIARIAGKTASLFCLAIDSGAILSHAPEPSIEILHEYAYNLGIAFQIVDDILDFTSTEKEMGKPIGADLTQGTLTLPAMLLLERFQEDNPVKRLSENRMARDNIKQAIEMVRNSSIIPECYRVAAEYSARASRRLHQLPDKPCRQALIDIADYVVSRKK